MHPFVPFISSQLLFAAFTLFIANKEKTFIKERRHYAPHNTPFDDPFHFHGLAAAVTVGVLATAWQLTWCAISFMPVSCMCIYWSLHTITVNQVKFGKWHYLGTTSKTDVFIHNTLGKNAGIKMFVISALVWASINIFFYLSFNHTRFNSNLF